jgi:hypothetical protein
VSDKRPNVPKPFAFGTQQAQHGPLWTRVEPYQRCIEWLDREADAPPAGG